MIWLLQLAVQTKNKMLILQQIITLVWMILYKIILGINNILTIAFLKIRKLKCMDQADNLK